MPFEELARGSIDSSRRLRQLHILLVLALTSGVFLSPLLWFGSGRTFPRAPILFRLSRIPILIDSILSIVFLASLGISIFSKNPQRYLVLTVGLIAFLAALDQTRLQPWVFQYAVMLSLLAAQSGSIKTSTSAAIRPQQFVIASLYFWSGAQKINWSFSHDVIPSLLQSTNVAIPMVLLPYLPVFGFFIAALEMFIGVGLVVRRTRRTAAILAICMHAIVLVVLIASRRNSVVWPWNIAMVAMVVLLFLGTKNAIVERDLFWRSSQHAFKIVFVLCGIAPALSFVGWWDLYLSAALYTGTSPVGVMRLSESMRDKLPQKAQAHLFRTGTGELILSFYEWSIAELNTPPYPEPRAYRQIAKQICEYSSDVSLIVKSRPSPIDGSYRVSTMSCANLFDPQGPTESDAHN